MKSPVARSQSACAARWWTLLRLLGAGVVACLVASCAADGIGSDPSVSEAARAGEDRTGRLRLELAVKDAGGIEELYIVEPQGTLSFGGGQDAWLGRTSWTGPMTDQEIEDLLRLIQAHHWREHEPESIKGTGSPDRRYRVKVNSPTWNARFDLKGEHPDVGPVRDLLSTISRRHVDEDLQRLRQPGQQKY